MVIDGYKLLRAAKPSELKRSATTEGIPQSSVL